MPAPKKKTNNKKSQVGGKGGTARKDLTEPYRHPTAESLMRPEVGTQAQFRKKKPPVTYRYDSSLSPALEWDEQNPAREQGEALIAKLYGVTTSLAQLQAKIKVAESEKERAKIQAEIDKTQSAVIAIADGLKAIGKPFLNWAGKAERLSFDVPTLPLFVHERLSTKAIIETLASHKKDKQMDMFNLFGDPQHSITDQILKAYEYKDKWVNRLVLGDSLVVMNSLVHYEGLGGQVQMIYMDPPYGVKFGSNFQPFVRKRDVKHNEDDDMTREPEMVKAYRDTWELGLHSYLTYMRDRLLIARELLASSGSIFVQISDENLHHVREVMDEVFGTENFISTIVFQKTSSEEGEGVANMADYLLWYCKDKDSFKSYPLFRPKRPGETGAKQYTYVCSPDFKTIRRMTPEELAKPELIPSGWVICRKGYPLTSQDYSPTRTVEFLFEGKKYLPGKNRHWSVSPDKGLPALVQKGRLYSTGNSLSAIMLLKDMPGTGIGNVWTDTGTGSFTDEQIYVVQTGEKVVQRCILMTTQPGDIVLDITCGSGTTPYIAEYWGRRWIAVDISRVPLALARQRLLSATYPWFILKDNERGPAAGFEYKSEHQTVNKKVDGFGIALQHTLSSIAGDEPAKEVIYLENPERNYSITRVSGPFCLEATIPTPVDWEGDGIEDSGAPEAREYGSFVDRMLEVLRRSPVLHLDGGKTVELKGIRKPAKTLSLSAEAVVENPSPPPSSLQDASLPPRGEGEKGIPVAILFGPENGAISEKLVYEAAREAHAKNYSHLFVIGFAIQPGARNFLDNCEAAVGVPATYVQATPDLLMGDLLKNMRSSQIFSVCGLPEVALRKLSKGTPSLSPARGEGNALYEVELLGLDVFDPITMMVDHRKGGDVPAWFLDVNYNGLCFHVSQAFFPRTSAWDNLKRALKSTHEESVWDHLAGTVSASFEAGEHGQIAVKVIDDRGNELLVVKSLSEAKG